MFYPGGVTHLPPLCSHHYKAGTLSKAAFPGCWQARKPVLRLSFPGQRGFVG